MSSPPAPSALEPTGRKTETDRVAAAAALALVNALPAAGLAELVAAAEAELLAAVPSAEAIVWRPKPMAGGSVAVALPRGETAGHLAIEPFADHAAETAAVAEVLGRVAGSLFPRRIALAPDERKLASLAEFAAGAGHEINNPLATILARVQLLQRRCEDDATAKSLDSIGGQTLRIRDMIGDVMAFARPPAPQPDAVPVVDLLAEAAAENAERAAEQNVAIESAIAGDRAATVWCDRRQIVLALAELVRNAVEAAAAGDAVALNAQEADGDQMRVTVAGPSDPLTLEVAEHLFDPFFSGRGAGRGLGFGLPKAWRLIDLAGGTIAGQYEVPPEGSGCAGGRGRTSFEVRLPRSPGDADRLLFA